jgi:hypothetical protein
MSKEQTKSISDFSPRWLEIVIGFVFVVIGISFLGLEILLLMNTPKPDGNMLFFVIFFTLLALLFFKISYRTFKRRPKPSGSIQCNDCGATTEVQDSFFNQRRLFGASFRTFCPLCWNKQQLSNQKWNYLFSLLLSILGLLLLVVKPDSKLGYIFINLFLLHVIDICSNLLHELAHAWTGRKLGFRIFKISIGRGKTIYKCNLFGFEIEFNSIPVMGLVLTAYPGKLYSKFKRAMFTLAGPTMNLIIALIAFMMLNRNEVWSFGILLQRVSPVHVLFYTNLLLLVTNNYSRVFL